MKKTVLFFSFLFISLYSTAQDDLLQMLKDSIDGSQAVIGTFKSTKLINLETNETLKKKTLDVRISHLFGPVGSESGGNVHSLFGLDQSDDIRLGFHYGLTDRIMIGISRAKRFENLEALLKIRLLEQTVNGKIPLSLSFFGNTTWSARNNTHFSNGVNRLTYCYQLVVARKINSRLSLMVIPTFIHRNLVVVQEHNNTFSVSGGLRLRFSPSTSLISDYSHTPDLYRPGGESPDVLGLGVEIETGGHVFTIMFSNASGLLENDFLVNTFDEWKNGGFKLSFIISRIFKTEKEEKEKN
jgi:hypothetical protein